MMTDSQNDKNKKHKPTVEPVVPMTCGRPAYVLPEGYYSPEYGTLRKIDIEKQDEEN